MRGIVAVTITTDMVLKAGAASHDLDDLIGAALRTGMSRPAADIAAVNAYMLPDIKVINVRFIHNSCILCSYV
jgi:hypothetical protein